MIFLKDSRKDVTCGKSIGSQVSPSGRIGSWQRCQTCDEWFIEMIQMKWYQIFLDPMVFMCMFMLWLIFLGGGMIRMNEFLIDTMVAWSGEPKRRFWWSAALQQLSSSTPSMRSSSLITAGSTTSAFFFLKKEGWREHFQFQGAPCRNDIICGKFCRIRLVLHGTSTIFAAMGSCIEEGAVFITQSVDISSAKRWWCLKYGIPSLKLTFSHLKNGWLEDDPASFWGMAYFQGRTVSFREGVWVGEIQSSRYESPIWIAWNLSRDVPRPRGLMLVTGKVSNLCLGWKLINLKSLQYRIWKKKNHLWFHYIPEDYVTTLGFFLQRCNGCECSYIYIK